MRRRLESLDKACLAATTAPWASFAPTWRLEYRGQLTREELSAALGWTVKRYPWCAARVERSEWVMPDEPALEPEVLDLRGVGDEERTARERALANRFLDVEKEAPLRVTWVRRADDAGVLVFQQQHALADGRAFLAMLGDFVRCLDVAQGGLASTGSARTESPVRLSSSKPAEPTSSPLPSGIVERRREYEVLAERGLARAWAFVRGALHSVAELLRATLTPVAPLFSNQGTDYTGPNRTLHLEVPLARVAAWRERRKALGLSENDVLAGALCVALRRWSRALGTPGGQHNLLMPIDVRPREGFESFANHLSSVQVRWDGRGEVGPLALAKVLKAAAAPILAARLPWRRVLFDRLLVLATPLSTLRKTLMEKRQLLTNYSFSNLVPLGTPGAGDDGRWRTRALVVERLLITTPCTPPQAANTTVARYGDTLCFNFNFKQPAVSEEQVGQLVNQFSTALDELERELTR